MLRKKQIASYIDANFGKLHLEGGMYYDCDKQGTNSVLENE